MSSATSNTVTTNQTTSNAGLIIGLTVGGIILLMLIVFFVIRSRKDTSTVPTAANGLGVMNKGPNVVPRTNMNMNSGSRIQ
jgi:hypothetical protein